MTKDDSITLKVKNMYKKYPYPSPSTDVSQTNELLNLLRIFELESEINLFLMLDVGVVIELLMLLNILENLVFLVFIFLINH